jgi:hypothetical protein
MKRTRFTEEQMVTILRQASCCSLHSLGRRGAIFAIGVPIPRSTSSNRWKSLRTRHGVSAWRDFSRAGT